MDSKNNQNKTARGQQVPPSEDLQLRDQSIEVDVGAYYRTKNNDLLQVTKIASYLEKIKSQEVIKGQMQIYFTKFVIRGLTVQASCDFEGWQEKKPIPVPENLLQFQPELSGSLIMEEYSVQPGRIPILEQSPVSHPPHYNQGKIEVIEFIEDKKLGYNLGNVVKYVSRAGVKDPAKHIEDLEKAKWYLSREIEILFSEKEGREKIRPNDMVKE